MKALRLTLQILLPVIVIALGALAAIGILSNKQQPIVRAPADEGPLVRTMLVEPTSMRMDVTARGTVEALRTVELAAEVAGRIVATHAALRAGGAFTPNDVLVELEATDYELAITQQESAVARAELRLLQEEAEAEAAVRAWRQLEGNRPADPLVRRDPQIRDARLAVDAAKALLARSRLDLNRTKVMLPLTGRIRSVHADIGQTVQRGQRLAVVIDTTELEVRLPVPLDDLGFLDLPLQGSTDNGPQVMLSASFGGQLRSWPARIVRTEGELDRRSRQLTVVARVTPGDITPGNGEASAAAPLLVGMFVDASIVGRTVDGVFVVPRAALHYGDHLWIVELPTKPGDKPRLRKRAIDVLRAGRDSVVLRSGLARNELVCLSNLEAPVDGMAVRLPVVKEDQ